VNVWISRLKKCVVHCCQTIKNAYFRGSAHPALCPLHTIALPYATKIDNHKAIFAHSIN
jgi:hypothetical protein